MKLADNLERTKAAQSRLPDVNETIVVKFEHGAEGNATAEAQEILNAVAAREEKRIAERSGHKQNSKPLPLSVSAVRSSEDLQTLAPLWRGLFDRIGCDNVFLSFEWMSEWWVHFGEKYRLFLVTVRDDSGRLVGLAPFYIAADSGPFRIRRLGFLGDRLVGSDHLDVLVDTDVPGVIESICNFVQSQRREWDYLQLADTRVDSFTATAFQKNLCCSGMAARVAPSVVCPYVQLPPSSEQFLASLQPKLRQNLRARLRAIEREGPIEFVIFQGGAEMDRALDELFRLHGKRFAERDTMSSFLYRPAEGFHRAVIRSLSNAGLAQIYQLRLRDEPVAALYGFSAGKKFCFYQAGFDPAYSRFGVGSLLISHAIQSAISSGKTEFDFLRGDEPYKQSWASDTRRLYSIGLFHHGIKSRLAEFDYVARESVQDCKVVLRDGIRSRFPRVEKFVTAQRNRLKPAT